MVPFTSSLQVCPCIINDFHKTISSISGEVTRERTKAEDKYTGTGLITHLDMPEAQGLNTLRYKYHHTQKKESVHVSHQAPGRDQAENWTARRDYMEQQSTPTYVAALILSFNKSNTLPHFLVVAKQCQ